MLHFQIKGKKSKSNVEKKKIKEWKPCACEYKTFLLRDEKKKTAAFGGHSPLAGLDLPCPSWHPHQPPGWGYLQMSIWFNIFLFAILFQYFDFSLFILAFMTSSYWMFMILNSIFASVSPPFWSMRTEYENGGNGIFTCAIWANSPDMSPVRVV